MATTTAEKLAYLHHAKIGDCQRCELHKCRSKIVFGEGNPEAKIFFVGEAPGAFEDRTGRPFVGPSGKELEKWLEALGLKRDEVYIANVVKCRPLNNRDPHPDEKTACVPFLHAQIALIQPKFLVALGRHAGNFLAGTDCSMGDLRKKKLEYQSPAGNFKIPVVAVYHPSYVLRARGDTQTIVIEDLKRALHESSSQGQKGESL